VTQYGTSEADYKALVDSLPVTSKPEQFKTQDASWWILATLDQCTSEALWNNPIVEAMAIDNYIVQMENDPDTITDFSQIPTRPPRKRSVASLYREVPRNISNSVAQDTNTEPEKRQPPMNSKLKPRVLSPQTHYMMQTNAANSLNWVSALSRQTGLTGPFQDYESYLYDDRALIQSIPVQPWIYYFDSSGFLVSHPVRSSRHVY